MMTVQDVVGKLVDGKLRPMGDSYAGLTTEEIAAEYLRRCKEAGVCAGCYNRLDADDREFNGEETNICISCACY